MRNVNRQRLTFAALMGIAAFPGLLWGIAIGMPEGLLAWPVFTLLLAIIIRWVIARINKRIDANMDSCGILPLIGISLLSAPAAAETDLYRQSVRSYERQYCSADSTVTRATADFDEDGLLDEFEIAPCSRNLLTGERRAGAVIFWLSTLGGEEGDPGTRYYGDISFEYLGALWVIYDPDNDGKNLELQLKGRESGVTEAPSHLECYYEHPYENNDGELVPGQMVCE